MRCASTVVRKGFFTRVQSSCCPGTGGRGRVVALSPSALRAGRRGRSGVSTSRSGGPGTVSRASSRSAPLAAITLWRTLHARHSTVTDSLWITKSISQRAGHVTGRNGPSPADLAHHHSPCHAADAGEGATRSSRCASHPLRPTAPVGPSGRPAAQRRPSFLVHAGHWPQPDRAWSIWARIVCSSADASDGRPEPPMALQVLAENWYRP